MRSSCLRLFAFLVLLVLSAPIHADPLAQPSGRVVLTVNGKIAVTNRPGAADFDLAMLMQMSPTVVKVETQWTDGVQTFEGILVRELMERVGASGVKVEAKAMNDYKIDIPMADFSASNVIIAYRRNGQAMPVREKGPLWIIYPSDTHLPEVKSKMIWQLRSLEIR